MRAGKLDRLITIQRATRTQASDGSPVETWAAIADRRFASMRPISGEEQFSTDQVVGRERVEFRIRYSANVAALTNLDRIVYPALEEAGDDPVSYRLYDILEVHEIGRREGLLIIGQRRPDLLVIEADDGGGESAFSLDFSLPANSGYLALFEDI